MHILPQNKQEWWAALLFPFKAYTVIAPLMSGIFFHWLENSDSYRHFGLDAADAYPMLLMFPCAAILLFAALVSAFVGSKGNTRSCVGFGIAALILGYYLLPSLAHA
jgi:hypothetical protein